jgi:hypothetical protein
VLGVTRLPPWVDQALATFESLFSDSRNVDSFDEFVSAVIMIESKWTVSELSRGISRHNESAKSGSAYRAVMPPDGYTTVTISEETVARLSQVMVRHDLESMSLAIDYAAQLTLDEESMTNTELARLLYHRLQTDEDQ